jgi:hypothetical protein
MPFIPFLPAEIEVGKPVKKELWQKVLGNFDNHEQRILSLSLGASPVVVFNNDVLNASSALSLTGLAYFRAYSAFTVTTVKLEIFEKGIVTSGVLSYDIKKGTSLDPLTFGSILTAEPLINFATASDYDEASGTLDSAEQSVEINEYLRLDITSLPAIPVGKFRVLVYGSI